MKKILIALLLSVTTLLPISADAAIRTNLTFDEYTQCENGWYKNGESSYFSDRLLGIHKGIYYENNTYYIFDDAGALVRYTTVMPDCIKYGLDSIQYSFKENSKFYSEDRNDLGEKVLIYYPEYVSREQFDSFYCPYYYEVNEITWKAEKISMNENYKRQQLSITESIKIVDKYILKNDIEDVDKIEYVNTRDDCYVFNCYEIIDNENEFWKSSKEWLKVNYYTGEVSNGLL